MEVTNDLNIDDLYEQLSQNKIKRKLEQEKLKKSNETNDLSSDNSQNNEKLDCGCDINCRIEKYGYYICQKCGIQTNIIIDAGLETRDYGQNDTKVRNPRCETFKNDLSGQQNQGSSIVLNSFKTSTNIISKIHNWNSRSYEENTLQQDFTNMKILASNFGINACIIKEAQTIYKQISEQKHKKKAKKISIQAACIQCACKLNNVPRDSNEMALMFNISKKDIRRGAKQFEEIWCVINNNNNSSLYNDLKPNSSVDYLLRRCQQLKISDEIIELCREVCEYIEKEDFLIKHIPLSRVAVAIYFTCYHLNININKALITEACCISEVTINKCFQKLIKIKDKIIENTNLKNY